MTEGENLTELQQTICGKRIIGVEASQWSGLVHPCTNGNGGFISIRLDDGTILEAGSLFIREVEPAEAMASTGSGPVSLNKETDQPS